MKYIVLLTIDRHPPGTDVSGLYTEEKLAELVALGYVEEVRNRSARRAAREAAESADEQADILEELPAPVVMEGPEPEEWPEAAADEDVAAVETEEAAWQVQAI